MKKILTTILFLILFIPKLSLGAEMSFSASKSTFTSGEDFLVEVYLDTKDVKVNAIEGRVLFPVNLLELKDLRDGNSAINFWIVKPKLDKIGEVSFSGITTGGLLGPKIFLFSMVFNSSKLGVGKIDFSDMRVLENDGLGTVVETKKNTLSFSIVKTPLGEQSDLTIKDADKPENFNLSIAKDPNIFDNQYFLVFSTVDKGSGVDHYEVKESFSGFDGSYIVAESPYLLKDQTLKSKIYVKAVDKNGNDRIVKMNPQNHLVWFLQLIIFVIIIGICVFLKRKIAPKFLR